MNHINGQLNEYVLNQLGLSLYRFNCPYIKLIGSDIESIVLMFNQMTIMRCDKVIISIQLSIYHYYQINWIDIESNGNNGR